MNFDRRRLIDAMTESIGRIASRYNVPSLDMDGLAVATIIGELLRREEPAQAKNLYAAGRALALRLADVIGREVSATDIAHLQRLPPAIHESSDYASSHALLLELKGLLSSLVSRSDYPSGPDDRLRNIISSLCTWEGELLRLPTVTTTKAKHGHEVRQMLESSARAQGGKFEDAHVVECTKLIGGFANETTLFKLADKDGQIWDLVARASIDLELGIDGRDIGGEFFLLRYLYQGGVTVAEPIWLERDGQRYGARFLVTRKVEGNNFGTVVQAQRLSSSQIQSLATELAKIHTLPLEQAHPDLRRSQIDTRLVGVSTTEAVSDYLERWIRLWRKTGLENSPTVEATMKWLRTNLPQIGDVPVLVHGDYGLHNIVIQGDRIGGVLDWEMSHLGASAEDIAGLLASFQSDADAEEFMRHYIGAGGKRVTDFELEYCNVFRYFMMYVVMFESQLRFTTLPEVRPELLVLGANFIQTPALRMAQAIETAEKAKTRA